MSGFLFAFNMTRVYAFGVFLVLFNRDAILTASSNIDVQVYIGDSLIRFHVRKLG